MKREDNWRSFKDFIQFILTTVQSELDKESIESVTHYIDHDEYEMAFEGLFLEIMKLKSVPDIDLVKSREVGKSLKLNEEAVFDYLFWEKFESYIERSM